MEVKKTIKTINGTGEAITSFKGKLDCVIVKVHEDSVINDAHVSIESSLGYLIMRRAHIKDVEYIAPRKWICPVENDSNSSTMYDKFNLNETLQITVLGTDVIADIILRD